MIVSLWLVVIGVVCCDTMYVYSGFWSPLYDPRILGYRVDASFDHGSGKIARDQFQSKHGYRGENLVHDLGNGKGPSDVPTDNKVHGDVKFYYTFRGADNYQLK